MQSKLKALLENDRFIAIVGMLGSDGHGERANAAAMANKMLTEAGATWAEVLAAKGGSGGRVDNHDELRLIREVQQLKRELRDAYALHQKAIEGAAKDKKALKLARAENEKLLAQHAQVVHELRALKTQIERLREVREAKKAAAQAKGFGFAHAPDFGEDEHDGPPRRDYSKGDQPGPKYAFTGTIPFPKIRGWLDMLEANFWDDLSNWEKDFFGDFITNKKAVKSDKQYAVFQRTADKLGFELAF